MLQFLGTGAADTIPNAFCSCPVCTDARSNLAQKTRKRASFLIDEENLIDFGPDFSCATQQYNLNMSGIKNIFITHTHEDHFCISNFGLLNMSNRSADFPLHVYLSEKGYAWLDGVSQALCGSLGDHMDFAKAMAAKRVILHKVEPYKEFTVDKIKVFPIETTHRVQKGDSGEMAINYLFTLPDGHKILYACDTGIYTERALAELKDCRADDIILEATFGSRDNDSSSHLNAKTFVIMLNRFLENNIATPQSRVYATHINHKHDLTHEKYQEFFDNNSPIKVVVAHDGMQIWNLYSR